MTPLDAKFLVSGDTSGTLRILSEPLSLWGGYDVHTGDIIDATHPECGVNLAGRVLAMRAARGSSSSSSALVEAARCGTAPAAIILGRLDPILVIGGLIAADLYGTRIPVVLLPEDSWPALHNGANVTFSSATSTLVVDAPET